MKQFCMVALAAAALATTARAGVITINNATVSPGQYSSIAEGIAAAATGDTLLVQGSVVNYGSFTLTKRLTLIGPGHNPTDRQNTMPATLDNITISSNSGGSRLYGFSLAQVSTNVNSITNVLISNCLIRSRVIFQSSNCNNWRIDGCVFGGTGSVLDGGGYDVAGLTVSNSVFNGRIFNFPTNNGYHYIQNCLFLSNTTDPVFQSANYFYVNNSIFYRARPVNASGWVSFQRCSSFNTNGGDNSFSANSDGVARVVYENVNPQFESFPAEGGLFNYAHNYRLKATSPLKNGGIDGTDPGVYGGSAFSNTIIGYNQNGVPLNPFIAEFNITGPTEVNAGESLQISIKARVRN